MTLRFTGTGQPDRNAITHAHMTTFTELQPYTVFIYVTAAVEMGNCLPTEHIPLCTLRIHTNQLMTNILSAALSKSSQTEDSQGKRGVYCINIQRIFVAFSARAV